LPLINAPIYAASEGFFGSLASIYTDEYLLSPTAAFFEFIREEDIHQVGYLLRNESSFDFTAISACFFFLFRLNRRRFSFQRSNQEIDTN
jgi:hypothetical protein